LKAIIMAGGEGSRLRPLTCDRPKPMVPVANRPIMAYAIDLLKTHGITDIGVTLQYLPEAIREHFGDGSREEVSLRYFVEEMPLGTAGSVKNAQAFLDDTFIVVSGDALTDFDLSRAIAFHREKKALVTIVLTTVENPLEYGVVITSPDGAIRRFLEKPSWGEVFSDQVNTGIYILEPQVLEMIPPGQMFDFSKDLFPRILAQGLPMFGCLLQGYWCDIGNLAQYRQAQYDLMDGLVKVAMPGNAGKDQICLGTGVDISPSARIVPPAIIGDYSVIGPHAAIGPHSILGDRVTVEEGASVKRTIVWDNCYLGKGAELRGAVLARQVTVQAKASVFEGAVIGDGTRLSERSLVKPDVKIWPFKAVDQDSVVAASLVWGTRAARNLFGNDGVPGLANLDLTPEFAAKVGAAYGTTLPREARVAVSHDGSQACMMLKSAMVAGLMSTGAAVVDLGLMTTPVHRFAVRSLGVNGGIHIKRDARDREKAWLHFIEHDGNDIRPGNARKIENFFWREDFRRVKGSEVGAAGYLPRCVEAYREHLLAGVERDAVIRRRFRLIIDHHAPHLTAVIGSLWEQLGCQVQGFAVPIDTKERSFEEMRAMLPHLAREVVQQEADLGVLMDHNGEQLVLVDETGRMVEESLFTALVSMVIFQANGGGQVAVPVSAPGAVEQVAERYGGKVVRTKTARHAILEAVLQQEMLDHQGRYAQAWMQFDAVHAVVKLLNFLATSELTLARLVDQLPSVFVSQGMADCPWDAKGRVIRSLIEEAQGERVELLDGLKIHHNNGWALVLPHAEEPSYQVISEGYSQEMAEELTNLYVEKIKEILADKQKHDG